ncbi:Pentatricopeptide repeat domain-containing protein 3, mitochondrial [Xenotaenia resolanae]|uniref:Small ribosomal subunit protein mS39 n=1 Tax=Xenotaenia resolanae TaxID=208358 RepID=A0ABV0X9D7_9TELE
MNEFPIKQEQRGSAGGSGFYCPQSRSSLMLRSFFRCVVLCVLLVVYCSYTFSAGSNSVPLSVPGRPVPVTQDKLFSLSQESGRAAAKYFVNNNPKFFTKDFAEPHIPCLMPESVALRLEEVSEEALKERITLRKVSAAVEMYDQLLQAGTSVSMETTQELLDLICLYCDKNPVQEGAPEVADAEEAGEEMKRRKPKGRRAADHLRTIWKENNNAERIFNVLPEKDSRCYSALIRGMVKHGAYSKAFSLYTDLLNNRLSGEDSKRTMSRKERSTNTGPISV